MGLPAIAAGLSAGSSIMGGMAAYSQAQGVKNEAELNASIARTRAVQTDVSSRQGMEQQLANMRAVFGANGQKPGVGTLAMFNALRENANGERVINVNNQLTQAADYNMKAKNAQNAGTAGLLHGIFKAGPSMFDLYQMGTH